MIVGIFFISFILTLFAVLLPAFIGIAIGWFWIKLININRKINIDNAEDIITQKEKENNELQDDLNQGYKERQDMINEHHSSLINLAQQNVTNQAAIKIDKLETEYQKIISHYYKNNFSREIIDIDIKPLINGHLPNTFRLSNNFRNEFKQLSSQISNIQAVIKSIEDTLLFMK